MSAPASEQQLLAWARLAERTLCRKHECCATAVWDGGRDGKGRNLVVAAVRAPVADCLIPRPPSPPRKRPPLPADAAEAAEDPAESSNCHDFDLPAGGQDHVTRDHYLLVVDQDKVRATQFLTSACPYDDIEVDAEKHVVSQSREGGRQLGERRELTYALDPPRLAAEDSHSCVNCASDPDRSTSHDLHTDWDAFTREETWSLADCSDDEKANTPWPYRGEEGPAALGIPMLPLPAAFTGGGWKTTALGQCAAFVDGDRHGYTIHGEGGGASDASMRVVLSDKGTLFIEVTDDKWIGPSKNWVKDDHVELWQSEARSTTECGWDAAKQWGVRIADGTSFAAFGSPPPLNGVQVVRRGSVARIAIPLGDSLTGGLTVVYSDSDDGKKQKRLIATSRLLRGRSDTLGVQWSVPEGTACVVKHGTLAVVSKRPKPAEGLGGIENLSPQ